MRLLNQIIAILLLAAPGLLKAEGAGTSNADFQKIGVGARPAAMGQAFTASADDSNANFWNPAGLALVEKGEASVMHMVYVADISYDTLSVAFPSSRLDGWGLSAAYLWQPPFDSTQNTFSIPTSAKPKGTGSDLALAASFGHNLGNFRTTDFKISNISVGATLRLISRTLQDTQATALNADFGGIMELLEGLRLGIVFQNIGTTATFISSADASPVNSKLGLAWNFHFNDANSITLAYDIQHPIDLSNQDYNRWQQSLGAEYWLLNSLALRGGYQLGVDVGGLSAGAGFHMGNFGVDYAFVPYSALGNSHRLSLSLSFGNAISRPDVAAPNPPRGLKGVAYDRLVSLAWEAAPEKDVIGYNVYYSKTSSKDFIRTNEKPEPKQNSLNVRLNNDVVYYFVITAVNAAGKESEFSDEIPMKPHAPDKPKAPADLKAEVSGRTVSLTWKPLKDSKVIGYNVYFSKSAGQSYRKLTKVAPLTDPECRLRGLTPDASYFFVITSVTKEGLESDYSPEISAKPRQETLNDSKPETQAPGAKKRAAPVNDEPF